MRFDFFSALSQSFILRTKKKRKTSFVFKEIGFAEKTERGKKEKVRRKNGTKIGVINSRGHERD